MNCPRCKKPLTEAQIKSLWASLTSSKRITKRGGSNAPGWPKGKPRKLPTVAELSASDPDFTGTQSTEEFVRSIRRPLP